MREISMFRLVPFKAGASLQKDENQKQQVFIYAMVRDWNQKRDALRVIQFTWILLQSVL